MFQNNGEVIWRTADLPKRLQSSAPSCRRSAPSVAWGGVGCRIEEKIWNYNWLIDVLPEGAVNYKVRDKNKGQSEQLLNSSGWKFPCAVISQAALHLLGPLPSTGERFACEQSVVSTSHLESEKYSPSGRLP